MSSVQLDLPVKGQSPNFKEAGFSGFENSISEARRSIAERASLIGNYVEVIKDPRSSPSPKEIIPDRENQIVVDCRERHENSQKSSPCAEREVDVDLHRRFFPPSPGSFPTTEIASELVRIFEDLGTLSRSQFLRECLLGGSGIDDRMGNGLASLSRNLFKLYNSLKNEDVDSTESRMRVDQWKCLGEEFGRILAKHYNTGSEATRLIIDQLRDIAGVNQERLDLPDLRRAKESSNKSCGDVEFAFVKAIKEGNFSKDELFIYKSFGAPTALSRVPFTVDGMLVPAGTLCLVEKDGLDIRVKPLRHTMFSIPEEQGKLAYDSHYRTITKTYGLSDQDINAVYREMRPDLRDTSLKTSLSRLLKSFMDYFSTGMEAKS